MNLKEEIIKLIINSINLLNKMMIKKISCFNICLNDTSPQQVQPYRLSLKKIGNLTAETALDSGAGTGAEAEIRAEKGADIMRLVANASSMEQNEMILQNGGSDRKNPVPFCFIIPFFIILQKIEVRPNQFSTDSLICSK